MINFSYQQSKNKIVVSELAGLLNEIEDVPIEESVEEVGVKVRYMLFCEIT